MMHGTVVVAAWLLIALPTSALAQSVLGTWACKDDRGEARLDATFSFAKTGILTADMRMTFRDDKGADYATGHYAYRSRFRQVGKMLHEKPTSVKIISFKAWGQDVSRGMEARMIRDQLMKDNTEPQELRFPSANRLELLSRKGGHFIACVRKPEKTG